MLYDTIHDTIYDTIYDTSIPQRYMEPGGVWKQLLKLSPFVRLSIVIWRPHFYVTLWVGNSECCQLPCSGSMIIRRGSTASGECLQTASCELSRLRGTDLRRVDSLHAASCLILYSRSWTNEPLKTGSLFAR